MTPHPATNPDVEAILVYWLGSLEGPTDVDRGRSKIWWGGDDALDAEVSERFGDLVRAARNGELDAWCETPRSALALVILLDQFTRNLYRGTGEAFAADGHALAIALKAIERGHDRALRLIERAFLYMPMMHAESRAIAKRSVQTFAELSAAIQASGVTDFPDFHASAVQHADIIERFGRYPHRNALLAREPTAEEQSFLEDGGPSFGQSRKK